MLKVTHDGSGPGDIMEHCCLCRSVTRFWYTPFDVALCTVCASTAERKDLPTKEEWCRKEKALMPKTYGWP